MKATINEKRFIVVTAESAIERFALSVWMERMDAPESPWFAGVEIDLGETTRPEPVIAQPRSGA